MAIEIQSNMTVTEFDSFVELPENSEILFEYIGGEVFEVPSNTYVSKIAARIIVLIGIYLMKNDIGHLTGEGGGYMVSGDRYAPDVAFISYKHQLELLRFGYIPNPPDLAVEVISEPDNRQEQANLRIKLTSYLAAGVLVWIVNPDEHTVEVHQVGTKALIFKEGENISGGDILPDFELAVKDVFPAKPDNQASKE